jgi:hypothetical protein
VIAITWQEDAGFEEHIAKQGILLVMNVLD